ncbi:MAG: DUF4397 domain-containing protein [Gammaproteobacteria bacterium]|nr:DUF4397 domain-containing protein [Gammaproteobacteria bacterium]
MSHTHAPVFSLLVAAVLAAGCESGDQPLTPLEERAELRFIHASPDAPSVDIVGPVTPLVEDLEYKSASPVLSTAAGTTTLRVDADVPGGPVAIFGPEDVELAADTVHNVIAIGRASEVDALVLTAPAAAVSADSVRAQVVHAAPDAPAVDVYVTAPDAALEQENPLGSLEFGEATDPVEVPAGEYQIRVSAAGDPASVVFDSGPVTLPGGADLLIVAVENTGPGDAPVSLVVADDRGSFEILDVATPAEVRAIHASPDAPAVDVIVNDDFENPALADVTFGTATDYHALPPGTYNVKVTPAGNPGVIAIDANLDLAAGTRYSVYAADVLASIAPYVLVDDNRPVATEAKVRIVHLAPGAGAVDIYVTEPGADLEAAAPAFANVAFRDETGYVSLAGGEYDVTVTPAGTKEPAIGPTTVELSDGGVYTAAARDAEGGGAPFELILLDDFVDDSEH